MFIPYLEEDFQFDDHIFQMGWFNHQAASMVFIISLGKFIFFGYLFFPTSIKPELTGITGHPESDSWHQLGKTLSKITPPIVLAGFSVSLLRKEKSHLAVGPLSINGGYTVTPL